MASWKVLEGPFGEAVEGANWRTKSLDEVDIEERNDGKDRRVLIPGIPEQTRIKARVAAVGPHGQSAWSDEVEVETLATPCADNGFAGLLGPAARSHRDGKYSWQQTANEIRFQVPIPDGWKAKDISFKSLSKEIRIHYKPPGSEQEDLLIGSWAGKIRPDDITWDIQTEGEVGRHISVEMRKSEQMEKWPSLLTGKAHPRIDTRLAALFKDGLSGGLPDMWE